jgi:hypothetical protein
MFDKPLPLLLRVQRHRSRFLEAASGLIMSLHFVHPRVMLPIKGIHKCNFLELHSHEIYVPQKGARV